MEISKWPGLWFLAIAVACASAQAAVPTQQQPEWLQKMIAEAATQAGSWDQSVMWEGRSRLYRLDETGSRGAHAQQIIDIFKRSSFLNPPHGMRIHVGVMGIGDSQYDFNPRHVQGAGPLPEGFRIVFTIFLGAPDKAGRDGDETGTQIIVNVNPMSDSSYIGSRKGALASRPLAENSKGRLLCGAPVNGFTPRVPAIPGLTADTSGSIVLTRLPGQLHIPVTKGEYVRALSATNPGMAQALAAMPLPEQARAALVGCSGPGTLCTESDPLIKGASPVVRLNKNYYNPHLPADSIQRISISPTHADVNPYGAYVYQQIWDSLDWSALLKLLSA